MGITTRMETEPLTRADLEAYARAIKADLRKLDDRIARLEALMIVDFDAFLQGAAYTPAPTLGDPI